MRKIKKKFTQDQGDYTPGKPVNFREFDSCQGTVEEIDQNQLNILWKILSGKTEPINFILGAVAQYFRYR